MKTKYLITFLLFSASAAMLFALPRSPKHNHHGLLQGGGASGSITLDPNFDAPFFAAPSPPARAVLLPDGKFVEFFNIDTATNQSTGPLVRFNADGTLDTTFSFSRDYSGVGGVASTSDGKLIIAAGKIVYGVGDPRQHQVADILRLNADGSIDSTFGPAQTTDGGDVRVVTVNKDGSIFVSGLFTAFNGNPTQGIVRLLPNGTVDPNFAAVSMTCPARPFFGNGCGVATEPVIDADGKIIIAGDFIKVNGVDTLCVARLNHDGTLDSSFNASGFVPTGFFNGAPTPLRGIGIQSDNKIVIGGRFNGGSCGNHVPLIRLNTDGIRDTDYIYTACLPPNGLFQVRGLVIDGNDRVIAIGKSIWRFNTDGSLDSMFHNPDLSFAQQSCAQTDICPEGFNIAFGDAGTTLFLGGTFSDIDDAGGPSNGERWGAAKFSASDGSLDTGFTTSGRVGFKIEPNSFLRRADGFTLIGFAGFPASYYPPISHSFGRLFSTGELDLTFDPIASFNPNGPLGPDFVGTGFTPFSDGSLLITGVNGVIANYGRLLADGSEDPNFQGDPNVRFANAIPRADGKLVVSQYDPNLNDPNFLQNANAQAAVDGTEVQRLNTAGSLDTTFHLDPAIVADTQDRDGTGHLTNVYVGSGVLTLTANNTTLFGYISRDGAYHLVRLNNDGSIDSSFLAQTFPVQLTFNTAQVNDPVFGTTIVNMYYPTELPVKQAKNVLDNKVVLMGSFASYGSTTAHGMLRIIPDGSADPTFSIGLGAQWTITPETDFRHPSIDNLEVGLDDKVLLTGTFEAFNGTDAPGIINLNPDGTIDNSFVAPVKRQIYDYQPAYLKRQSDGSFLLSGPYSRATDNFSPSFFRLLLPPGVPTPPGNDVTVNAGNVGNADDITVNFGAVNNGGSTTVALIDPNWAGQLPPGFEIAGTDLAFEIYTTSSYTAPITICFQLSSLSDEAFAVARILHNDGNGLIDVTSSVDPQTRTICGVVNSLSPFLVATQTTAVSRKTHGMAGTFDVDLPFSGTPGIECRRGGGSGNHQIVVKFGNPVSVGSASVTMGTGSVSTFSVSGSQVTVNLTGVANAQTINVKLSGINGGTDSVDIPMSLLLGDTNGNQIVNASDIARTKAQTGHPVTANNFRTDVNANGEINVSDAGLVKSASGTALP